MNYDQYLESGMDAGLDDDTGIRAPCRMNLHHCCRCRPEERKYFTASCVCGDNAHWGAKS